MSHCRLLHVESVAALRDMASAWDDLWWRSEVARPTVRAELVAQWVEQFCSGGAFHALAVEDQGQLVSALPLVKGARCLLLRPGKLPINEWVASGDLLLDQSAEIDSILDRLVEGTRTLPWPLVWLGEVSADRPRWTAFIQAAQRAGVAADYRPRWQVAWLPVHCDWQSCQQQWAKKHLAKMLKAARRLAEQGEVQLRCYADLPPDQVEPHLRRAFEIEDRSWKGQAGTSVLRTPGMFDFFLRQARQFAQWGQLELALLELAGRPIAFVYGFHAKGISHWSKIGYDPQYRGFTPGQLVQYFVLERVHRQADRIAIDTMGPLTDALANWQPQTYTVGRWILAPRLMGRPVVYACKHVWPRVRRWLGRDEPAGQPSPEGSPQPTAAEEPLPATA